jgi:hypothetical protein
MAADDRLASAIGELYGLDPTKFTGRRNALAAAARKSGAAEVAIQIAALRRPTRAAWVLNQLARSEPALAAEFAGLGDELRAAHQALDGTQIRELTRQRRRLIDETVARAFDVTGIETPTAALRDDVAATLGAVLADPDIAARFAAGALATAQDQSGFGPIGPQLTAVPALAESAPARPSRSSPPPRRIAAIAAAERDVQSATEALAGAEAVASEAADTVRHLTDQLADAKRHEDDAMLAVRHAQLQQNKAQQRLDGLTR